MILNRIIAFASIVVSFCVALKAQTTAPVPVTITVDAGHASGNLKPSWRWCGYDEPNYTYAPNGKKLVGQFSGDRNSPFGPAYFRAHNLLVTGDGSAKPQWGSTNAYTEDAAGNPIYDWTIVDRIFDTALARHVQPYVEIGFMPQALSTHPQPYQHEWRAGLSNELFTGWAYPPRDYNRWGELVYQW